ncbi:MAG: CoA transferase [Alphaproteobacteria bacterium]|nr:CoA transferase [Alphaproteobacteria bacterium]
MDAIYNALNQEPGVALHGDGALPSCFAVTDLAVASIGAVGQAIARLQQVLGGKPGAVAVDRRLASLWFSRSIYPIGWELAATWDAIAGDYETADGWIKLHTNLPHHRRAALGVLGCASDKATVERAVRHWNAEELETAIVEAGGVAAAMRSAEAWAAHPQGRAVAAEPLINWSENGKAVIREIPLTQARPLNGLRVLDLTRVLAGPVATRTLAGFGAEVLRIDPYGWEEANVVPDITLGKRCSRLNLKDKDDRFAFENLLQTADVLVHGYRPGALERLGYGTDARRAMNSNLIDISLDAYGWCGPWRNRRGFDSLVQMSCGIAHAGMKWREDNKPVPLPVQALDHATGYLMAAASITALAMGLQKGELRSARLSLARTGKLLLASPQIKHGKFALEACSKDFAVETEQTPWGRAKRLRPPLVIEGAEMAWDRPACSLGSAEPVWA